MTVIVFFAHKFSHYLKKNFKAKTEVSIFLGLFGFVLVFQLFKCHCIILITLAKQLFFRISSAVFIKKISKTFPNKLQLILFYLGSKIFLLNFLKFSTYFDRKNEHLREVIEENV